MEQHDLQINVDARRAESGLRSFDAAIDRTEKRLSRFATNGEANFRRLAAAAGKTDFSVLAKRATAMSEGFSGLARSASRLDSIATAAKRMSSGVATELGKSDAAIRASGASFERLARSVQPLTTVGAKLQPLNRNLRELSAVITGFNTDAGKLNNLTSTLGRLARAVEPLNAVAPGLITLGANLRNVSAGVASINIDASRVRATASSITQLVKSANQASPVRLAAMGFALGRLNGVRIDPNIAVGLRGIASAANAGRVDRLNQLVSPLRALSTLRIAAGTGQALAAVTNGLAGLRNLTPGRVVNFRDFVNTLRQMPPNLRERASSLVQLGQAFSGFGRFSASTASIQRFFGVLASANPGHIRELASALRALANSGISGLRVPNLASLNPGHVRAPAMGGGMGHGMRAGVSLPVGLGALSVSNQVGGAVAAGASVLSITAMANSIGETGRALDAFRLKMAMTSGEVGDAAKEWEFLLRVSDRLAMPLTELAEGYGKFAATMKLGGIDIDVGQKTFEGFATGFRAMGMNSEQIKGALRALEQMASKNQVMAEELKGQLGEHFPGAAQLMAQANGWSVEELYDLMESGSVGFDAVIKMGEHVGEVFGGSTAYSMNTAAASAQRFQNRMALLQETVFKSGFEEGLKGMFDTFIELADDPSAQENARALGQAFKTGFEMAGNAARWLVDHLALVKAAVGGLLAVSGIKVIAGLAGWLGSAAAGAIGLGAAFNGMGLAGFAAGLLTVATRVTALGGVAWAALEVFKSLNVGTIDWKNGLVEIQGEMYSFEQVARAAATTVRDVFGGLWQEVSPGAATAFSDIQLRWDQTWAYMQAKSAEGGGGVVGFFKQMSTDAIGYIRSLDPEFFAGIDRIVNFLRNGSDNKVLDSYRDVMNGLIGLTKFTVDLLKAMWDDMFERTFGVVGDWFGAIRDGIAGDLDGAYDHALQGGMKFFGVNPDKQNHYDDLDLNEYVNTDWLRAGFEAVETGGAELETSARNMEATVVDTFGQLAQTAVQMLTQFGTQLQTNLAATGGAPSGVGGPAPAVDARMAMAQSLMGLSEKDPADAKVIEDFILQRTGQKIDVAVTAWCAAIMNAILGGGTGSLMAKSYLDYGTAVTEPQIGDIVVFDRGGDNGHVGMFNGYTDDGRIKVLGGNQSNKFGENIYAADSPIAYRRPPASALEAAGLNGGVAPADAFQQGKAAELARIEGESAARAQEQAASAGPELPDFNAKSLTYEQWKRVDDVLAGILEQTGQLTVSELQYREAVNQVVSAQETAFDQAMSQQKSEQMLAGMTAEERARELAIIETRNAALKEAEQIGQDQLGNLRAQISMTQDLAKEQERLNSEAEKWKNTWEARERREGMTPTLSDWRNATPDMASNLAAAQGDPAAMVGAMDQTRRGLMQETDPYERMMQSMRDEYELASMTNTERSIETDLLARKNEMLEQGVMMTQEQEAATRSMIAQMQQLQAGGTNGFASWLRGAEDFNVALARVEEQALDGLIDKMTDFITTGKADWESLSNDIIKSITKIAMNELVKQFLTGMGMGGQQQGPMNMMFNAGGNMGGNMMGGQGSGGGDWMQMLMQLGMQIMGGFSEGGYSNQPVTAYRASGMGGLEHAPAFKYGGVTGDGGFPAILHDDEAVIPLSRNRRIPVHLTGNDTNANAGVSNRGNVTVIQNITAKDARSFRKSQKQVQREAHREGQRAMYN